MTRPSLINFRKGNYSHNVYYVRMTKAFLSLIRDVALWLRWRLWRRPTGPHIEAMAA